MNIPVNSLLLLVIVNVQVDVIAETLPDPTRPFTYTTTTVIREELPKEFINWYVKAIRISEQGRNAVVNDKLVKIGDEINSARIIDITENTVVLEHDRKELVLRLLPDDFKIKRKAALDKNDQ